MNRFAARALALAMMLTFAPLAYGQDAVTGVQVTELDEATEIRIHAFDHPSYSVYRLRSPLRLFVDITGSLLDGDETVTDVENGVVSQVAMTQYEDELTSVTRIVIGFEQEALYNVESDGDDLVITIEGAARNLFVARPPTTDREFALLESELQSVTERIVALTEAVAVAQASGQSTEADTLELFLQEETIERDRLLSVAGQGSEEELAQMQARLEESYARVETLEADRDAQERGLENAETSLTDQRTRLDSLETERGNALVQIEVLQAQAGSRDAQLGERDGRISRLQSELVGMNEQIRSLEVSGADADALARLNGERTAQLAALEGEQSELRQMLDAAAANEIALEDALTTARTSQEEQQVLIQEQSEVIAQLERERVEAAVVTTGPIQDIRFEHVDGVDRVVIEGSANLAFETLPYEDGRTGIVFGSTTLPDRLRRTLDTQAFGGPVSFVSSYTDADGTVRVVAELSGNVSEVLRQEGDALVWEFSDTGDYNEADDVFVNSAGDVYAGSVNSYSNNPYGSVEDGESEISLPRPRMTQKRITIDLRDADIQNVLRMIADEGNINIVAGEGVDGNVTLRLRSVPLDDALVVILRSQNLGWEQQGSIIRVAPMDEFDEAYEAEIARLTDRWRLEPLHVRILPLGYASANAVRNLVAQVISPRGVVNIDTRNNALIVTDVSSNLDVAAALVERVDTQTPQVLIEARIVETSDQFSRDLGIQWGFDFIADQSLGNATGLLFPSTFGVAGGADDGQGPNQGSSSTPNWAVNLPAPTGTGSGGAVGFTFGSLSQAFNLNLRLSAAEDTGSVKIVSAPRIMTLDNQSATIVSGVSIPVSVVSAAGAQTQFVEALLRLNVTPRVTPDGNVFLSVEITKNEPDFENTGTRGDPSIVRREASTQLLVRDGDTTVIGGIFTRNSGMSTSRVPFFGSLPVIGPLFRNSSQTDNRTELLVFITPRIVNRELSIDALNNQAELETVNRN
ncbi:MAG: type IV pilus assembly protein PilQ [Bradymonadia bacterium]|jgi:type IV pilus assembly protein PilQ